MGAVWASNVPTVLLAFVFLAIWLGESLQLSYNKGRQKEKLRETESKVTHGKRQRPTSLLFEVWDKYKIC